MTNRITDGFLNNAIKVDDLIGAVMRQAAGKIEPGGQPETGLGLAYELAQGVLQGGVVQLGGNKAVGHRTGAFHGRRYIRLEFVEFTLQIRRLRRQPAGKYFHHATKAGELLANIVVQFMADAIPLALAGPQALLLHAFLLGYRHDQSGQTGSTIVANQPV